MGYGSEPGLPKPAPSLRTPPNMEKLTISAREAYLLRRKTMIGKAKKHLRLALHWIDRLRELEKGS